ncbi:MarR family winged helix-turn-helix transcriptional regulator [Halalkalibacter alkalisediminis]|uniref:MarR family winged helix-turn-helix transcriptional regulator n=1 Tax=Halalkalibacter alkalisediminis TaxID=935616 RepID=A0ABV6NF20_9BACI|nr:MarR family transcriptional regulator [Halalkalibacter alkalisediminis]
MIHIVEDLKLFHTLHQLSRLLTKYANKALQPLDLYSAQWAVIYALKNKGTLTQTELCEYLAVEAPPLTRNIQRLVKKGYVRQVTGHDKRMKIVELTAKAHQEYPKWEHAILETKKMVVSHFPKSSEEQLDKLLSEWLGTITSTKHVESD